MIIPILMNHDHAMPPIGTVQVIDGRLMVELRVDMPVSKDMLFDIFGGAGIRVLQMGTSGDADGYHIFKGEILEFSLCPTPAKAAI